MSNYVPFFFFYIFIFIFCFVEGNCLDLSIIRQTGIKKFNSIHIGAALFDWDHLFSLCEFLQTGGRLVAPIDAEVPESLSEMLYFLSLL